jgi:histidine decarboxylase
MSATPNLQTKYRELREAMKGLAGYPCNLSYDYESLHKFMHISLNNVGDAFSASNYKLNTHEYEKEVVEFIASLFFPTEDFWGYITNGGSEGNLCGMHLARECYPGAIVYYSAHSHYSIEKAVRITRSDAIKIDVLGNGEIDYINLEQHLSENNDKPAIIMLNIGTTITGAIDDIPKVRAILEKLKIENFYIHADGALHGLILPFCDGPRKLLFDEFDSISISGHKFIGSPIPCGIFISHTLSASQRNYVEYVDIQDATITGSRNGFTPLLLWQALQNDGRKALQRMVSRCITKQPSARS